MSSVVVSTSAALGRPFVFDEEKEAEAGSLFDDYRNFDRAEGECAHVAQLAGNCRKHVLSQGASAQGISALATSALVTPASRLEIRPAPERVSSGIAAMDDLTGGLPRGCLTEIFGSASSGRTTVLLAALAAATSRGEFCAVIDASDALDPQSVAAASVDLDCLLWVRCGEDPQKKLFERREKAEKKNLRVNSNSEERLRNKKAEHRLEQVLRATDLLLESGGFGMIVLDLADVPVTAARRIPLSTWFRFRRAVENKPTILLAIEQQAVAGSCSSLLVKLDSPESEFKKTGPAHVQLLTGLHLRAELVRSRFERKPARSVTFATKAAWAG